MKRYRQIINLWFQNDIKKYFSKDSYKLDKIIKEQLEEDYFKALKGQYNNWIETPKGALALVILLDQVPRHLFRQSKEAYSSDNRALLMAKRAIKRNYLRKLNDEEIGFLLMPFQHSEKLKEQYRGIELYQHCYHQSKGHGLEFFLYSNIKHCEIIRSFGRFPKRNRYLGRRSTKQELEYMRKTGFRHF